mgnify:CR=1 FL=1
MKSKIAFTTPILLVLLALLISTFVFIYQIFYPRKELFSTDKTEFIMYKADWCGHCKRALPKFKKLKEELEEQYVPFTMVECTTNEERCNVAGIKGYPTFILEKEDGTKVEFTGALTTEGVKDFLQRNI